MARLVKATEISHMMILPQTDFCCFWVMVSDDLYRYYTLL